MRDITPFNTLQMKALIIEDEKLAAERLILLLRQYDPAITVVETLSTIREAIAFLAARSGEIDFALIDIQLADGPAFEIFHQFQPDFPVIFTTAYDRYALEAFQVMSVDYLLKPVTLGELARGIGRIKRLRHGPNCPDLSRLSDVGRGPSPPSPANLYRSRFLCKSGQRLQLIAASEVAIFCAEGHIVRLTTHDNSKYLIDYTLEELERLLDPLHFFRVNRNTIVHAASVGSVKPFVNNRLRISLKCDATAGDLIVSRERVADFKKWANS